MSFFAGILLGTGNNNQAYGNIVHDNMRAGIQIGNGATNSRVYNNTITGNKYRGAIVTGYQSGTIIANNIIYNNTGIIFEIQESISTSGILDNQPVRNISDGLRSRRQPFVYQSWGEPL